MSRRPLYVVNTPKGESRWFVNASISWNTMNLVSTPSKRACPMKIFQPKLPNSWHSNVTRIAVWQNQSFIHEKNIILMNDSFLTHHWIQHSFIHDSCRHFQPSFNFHPQAPGPWPEGSSMVIDTVRSKAPMVSFTKISRWKASKKTRRKKKLQGLGI